MNVKFIPLTFLVVLLTYLLNAQQVIKLYSGKAPGSESWNWEEKENSKNMWNTRVVYNVAQPTLTAYLPAGGIQTGTAVIVAPGGAFHTLSIESEGIDVAKWLNTKGVAAFVLKYRLVHMDTDDPIGTVFKKMSDFVLSVCRGVRAVDDIAFN